MTSICLALLTGLSSLASDGDIFAEPVQLMAGREPMGHEQMFPSPAFFDLDGDGALEVIVGDLVGDLMVSRRVVGDDLLAWTGAEPLERADGKKLKFNNW